MKEFQLVEELRKSSIPISSSVLSKKMAVSTRTIRNYVSRINQHFETPVIISSSKGYLLKKSYYEAVMFHYLDSPANNFVERRKLLIRQILLTPEGINWDIVLEEMNVSEATLKNDLKSVVHYFYKNELQIKKNNNIIKLSGEEIQIRKLMKEIFEEEGCDVISSFFKNQDLLTDDEVDILRQIVQTTFNRRHLVTVDFVMGQLIRYLVITISRLQRNCSLLTTNKPVNRESTGYQLSVEIMEELSLAFSFKYSQAEIDNLSLLIVGNTINPHELRILDEVIEPSFLQRMDGILKDIHLVYGINFMMDGFRSRFILHVYGLIERINKGELIDNPMLNLMNTKDLLVYDLALYVGNKLKNEIGLDIPEEELLFLSILFGVFLEEEVEFEPVTIGIVSPSISYQHLENKLIRKLEYYYGDKIAVNQLVDAYSEINDLLDTDIIVSTIPYKGTDHQEVVNVSLFITELDIQKIEKKIVALRIKRKIDYYQELTYQFFDETFFYQGLSINHKDRLIDKMGKDFLREGIVCPSFIQSLNDKEAISPSIIQNVAMPHSLNRDAKETKISVWYDCSSRGIKWEEDCVVLVLLLAINQEQQYELNDYFHLLFGILSEKQAVQQLINQKSFPLFIKKLNELIKNEVEKIYMINK
ncbi:BglG family transcription antiterminator [Vagococcus xieshaowenii]|uniref:PRD domain-containing protein n=1 Tax=Vagococcus xieshaowenii TaxID=2562451 RepID=A0AAJ5EDV7_9ENTE|nr:PRD domain-containing protein [Vagococcus xieshaowenii]QCA28724.1 PRD domain-containing protein [Vagococcus xieshaowenii]TFZ40468.1 PRD domain-containing protein [Vagococcus xieshaowenii]